MKFLFFDIECSEGKSMCSFGYVLTDESFNILEKEDILMNPESFFHTGAWGKKQREKEPGIELAYPVSEFNSSPKFPFRYQRIKSILETPDCLTFGFSHQNDAFFLNHACDRYKKSFLNYKFFDIQNIYGELYGVSKGNQVGLDKIISVFEINIEDYILHRSDEDAEVTMLAAKAICESRNQTLQDLVKECPGCAGEVRDGKCVYIEKEKRRIAELNKPISVKSNRLTDTNRRILKQYLYFVKPRANADSAINGKKFLMSLNFEMNNFREVMAIVAKLADRGAKYVLQASGADYYVEYGNDVRPCVRKSFVTEAKSKGADIKLISFEQFLKMINSTKEELSATPLPQKHIFEATERAKPSKPARTMPKTHQREQIAVSRSN